MTLNERLRDVFLRRALRRMRIENACVAEVQRTWRAMTRDVIALVKGDPSLVMRRSTGEYDVRPAAERLVLLGDKIRETVLARIVEMSQCLESEIPDLIRVELTELPAVLTGEVTRALSIERETSEAFDTLTEEEVGFVVDFATPPIAQASQLMATPLGGAFFQQSFGDLAAATVRALQNALINGLMQGSSVPTVARAVQGVLDNKRYEATRIVRSEYVRAGNQAALLTYQRNAQHLAGVQWAATLDKRSCLQCANRDGRVWKDATKAKIPVVNSHPNCLVPETRVEGDFLLATRVLYQGDVVRIVTRKGYALTVTPNHPVMSMLGMRPADSFCEGDYVLSRGVGVGLVVETESVDNKKQYVPASIEEVFESISVRGSQRSVCVSREHFHGDGLCGDGDVDIVALDAELLHDATEAFAQSDRDSCLVSTDMQEPKHACSSPFLNFSLGMLAPLRSLPRTAALSLDDCAVVTSATTLRPFQSLSVGSASDLHAALLETSLQHVTTDSCFIREFLHRFALDVAADKCAEGSDLDLTTRPESTRGEVAVKSRRADPGLCSEKLYRLAAFALLDQIVKIERRQFSGHVYDLQSTSGFIVAENIIISNCRCTLIPVIKSAREFGIAKPSAATRASMDGQVPATQTYPQWFAHQPASVQREILGPTRYALYSRGQLDIKDFAGVRGVRPVRDVLRRVLSPVKFDVAGDFESDEDRLADKFAKFETPKQRVERVKAKQVSSEEMARFRAALGLDPVPPAAFTPARTIQEAQNYAQRELGVTSKWGMRDLAVANTINRHLTDLHERGVAMPRRVLSAPRSVDRNGHKFVAAYRHSDDSLLVNPKMWGDAAKTSRDMYERRWWSSSDEAHALTHEIGHALHARTNTFRDLRAADVKLVSGKRSPFEERRVAIVASIRKVGSKVSRYAMTDPQEFVAEVFAGQAAGKTYSDDVLKVYRELEGPELTAGLKTVARRGGRGVSRIVPERVPPKSIRGSERSDSAYVYHATNSERMFDIADGGKLKTFGPSYGSDQRFWPDGGKEKRAYFTPSAQNTWQFAPAEGRPVLLRARRDALQLRAERGTSDLFSRKPIAARAFEYLGADDQWHSLVSEVSAIKTDPRLPEITKRVFTGNPVNTKLRIGGKGRTKELGDVGETIVRTYLSQNGIPVMQTNGEYANFPVDLVAMPKGRAHEAAEVKTGEVFNLQSAQNWRLKFDGRMPDVDKAKMQAHLAKLPASKRAAAEKEYKFKWGQDKIEDSYQRKVKALEKLKRECKCDVRAVTYALIVNADAQTADIFKYDGWHKYMGWRTAEKQGAYVTTVSYRDVIKAPTVPNVTGSR